jgi:hypothetical protein
VTIRWVRGGVVLFFLLFIAAVTWPGMTLGNQIFPLIFGLPTSMVWIASFVALSFLVLVFLDHMEGRARGLENPRNGGGGETSEESGASESGASQASEGGA